MSFLSELFSKKSSSNSMFDSNIEPKDPNMLGFKFTFDDVDKADIMINDMKKKGYDCSMYPKGKKIVVEIDGFADKSDE